VSADRATYVYCLVRSRVAPSLSGNGASRAPSGLPGASPARVVAAGPSLHVVVASVPLPEFSQESIDARLTDVDWVARLALAHAALIQSLAVRHDVVPMKLFTIFSDDERAAARIRASRGAVARAFRAVSGCAEWGVKIAADAARASALARERAREAGRRSVARPGAAFLVRKRLLSEVSSGVWARARARADEAHRVLRAKSRRAIRRRAPVPLSGAARPILDGVYLVPRGRSRAFHAAVEKLSSRCGEEGLRVELSGPWPPYSFVGDGP